jgi:hypothetical protein
MLENFVATTLEDFYQLPEDVTEIVQIILTLLASDLSIGGVKDFPTSYNGCFLPVARERHRSLYSCTVTIHSSDITLAR